MNLLMFFEEMLAVYKTYKYKMHSYWLVTQVVFKGLTVTIITATAAA
jgi:hypothetical protein